MLNTRYNQRVILYLKKRNKKVMDLEIKIFKKNRSKTLVNQFKYKVQLQKVERLDKEESGLYKNNQPKISMETTRKLTITCQKQAQSKEF